MSDYKFEVGESVIIDAHTGPKMIGTVVYRAHSEESGNCYSVETHGLSHSSTNAGNNLALGESVLHKRYPERKQDSITTK